MMNIFQKSLLLSGVLGLGSAVAAPAFAGGGCCGNAYISGSSSIVLMNGASQSVGAELAAPIGTFFTGVSGTGDVTVTPLLTVPAVAATAGTGLDTNANDFASLNVNAGVLDSVTALAAGVNTSFTAAAAAALDAAVTGNDLSAQVSIIRAGAGVDGLQ